MFKTSFEQPEGFLEFATANDGDGLIDARERDVGEPRGGGDDGEGGERFGGLGGKMVKRRIYWILMALPSQ